MTSTGQATQLQPDVTYHAPAFHIAQTPSPHGEGGGVVHLGSEGL